MVRGRVGHFAARLAVALLVVAFPGLRLPSLEIVAQRELQPLVPRILPCLFLARRAFRSALVAVVRHDGSMLRRSMRADDARKTCTGASTAETLDHARRDQSP